MGVPLCNDPVFAIELTLPMLNLRCPRWIYAARAGSPDFPHNSFSLSRKRCHPCSIGLSFIPSSYAASARYLTPRFESVRRHALVRLVEHTVMPIPVSVETRFPATDRSRRRVVRKWRERPASCRVSRLHHGLL